MDIKEFKTEINNTPLTVKSSSIANQTNGSLIVQMGDTTVLVTTVMGKQDKTDYDSMPLSVDYEEKYYATGKIYGSRFLRRESRPTDLATLISRMIDRTIRPLFNPLLRREVQVNVTCLSMDETNSPDIVGMIGASLTLMISDIP
jgi:polyribonucleotide nucleotidyltransferase